MKENKKQNMLEIILFKIIKFTDIAYVSTLFFIVGYYFGIYIDYFCLYLFGKNFNEKQIIYLMLEILFQIHRFVFAITMTAQLQICFLD